MFLNDFNRDSNFRNVDINMNNINCNSQCMRAAVDLYINKIQERLWKSFLFKKSMLWTYIFSKSKEINILNLITLYNISIEFPMIRLKVWLVINSCKDKKRKKKRGSERDIHIRAWIFKWDHLSTNDHSVLTTLYNTLK